MATKRAVETAPARPGPRKGTRPDFSGVPGEIVAIDDMNLAFGAQARISPYDALLDELAEAGPGKALKFGDLKARTSVGVRARKKGLKVSFAAAGGALYVRVDGCVADDVKARRRTQILEGLRASGGATPARLAVLLREKGDGNVDAQLVGAILGQMLRDGSVVRAEGDIWRLNPTAKKTS